MQKKSLSSTSSISKRLDTARRKREETKLTEAPTIQRSSFTMKTLPPGFPKQVASVITDEDLKKVDEIVGLRNMMLTSPVAYKHLEDAQGIDTKSENHEKRHKRRIQYGWLKWQHYGNLRKKSVNLSPKCIKFLYASDVLFVRPQWCEKVLQVPASSRERFGIDGLKAFQKTPLKLIKKLTHNDFDKLTKSRFYSEHKEVNKDMMLDYCSLPAEVRDQLDEKDLKTVYFLDDAEPYFTKTEPAFWAFYLNLPKKIRLELRKKKIGYLNHAFSFQGDNHDSRLNLTNEELLDLSKKPGSYFEELYKTYGKSWIYVLGLDDKIKDAFDEVRQNKDLRAHRWHLEDFELFDILAHKTDPQTLTKALSSKDVGQDFLMAYIFEHYFSKNIYDNRIVDRFLIQAQPYDLYQVILMMEGRVPEDIARKFLQESPELIDRLEPHIITNLMRSILRELDPDDGMYITLLVEHLHLPEEFLEKQEAQSKEFVQRLKNLNLLKDGISTSLLMDAWQNFSNEARWPLSKKQKILNKFAKKYSRFLGLPTFRVTFYESKNTEEVGYTDPEKHIVFVNISNPAFNSFISTIAIISKLIYKFHIEQIMHSSDVLEMDAQQENPEFVAAKLIEDTFAKDVHLNVFGVHNPADILAYFVSGKIAILFEEYLKDKQNEVARKRVKLRHGNLFAQPMYRETEKGKVHDENIERKHHIIDKLLMKMYNREK